MQDNTFNFTKQLQVKKSNSETYIEKLINNNTKFKNEPILVVNEIKENLGEYTLITNINTIIDYCLLVKALPEFYDYIKNTSEINDINIKVDEIENIKVFNQSYFQWSLSFLEVGFDYFRLSEAKSLVRKNLKKSYQYWEDFIVTQKGYTRNQFPTGVQVIWKDER